MPDHAPPSLSWLTRAIHYSMLLAASAAWLTATLHNPVTGEEWAGHRLLGLLTAAFLACGLLDAVLRRAFAGWLGDWRDGLEALRGLARGDAPASVLAERVLRPLIPLGLLVAGLVILSGAPSLVSLDRVFHPAPWVLAARRIHAIAAAGLMTLWLVDLFSLICNLLQHSGRGRFGSSGPMPGISQG